MAARLMGGLMAALVILSSCGDGDSAPAIPLENYCDSYAKATCKAANSCKCLDGIGIDICTSFQRAECDQEIAKPVREGRRVFSPSEAGRCLPQIVQIMSDCSLTGDRMPAACDRMHAGLRQSGQSCEDDEDCQSPMECLKDICVQLPGAGQACHGGNRCKINFYCGSDKLCHAEQKKGGSCKDGTRACAEDLYCDTRNTTCQPYGGAGVTCAHDSSSCDDNLYCSTTTQVCKSDPGDSQSCADSSGTCADNHYCDGNKICRKEKGSGSPCQTDNECISAECKNKSCQGGSSSCPFL